MPRSSLLVRSAAAVAPPHGEAVALVIVAEALAVPPDGTTTWIGVAWVAVGSVLKVRPAGPVKYKG
jgi:hypothetical protein